VPAEEGTDLLEATRGLVEGDEASLINSADCELQELVLFSREDEPDRARDAVLDTYHRLRRAAGLGPEHARVVSLEQPSGKDKARAVTHRLDVTIMHEAKRVLDSESHLEWVVVLAQTACEVYVREILDRRAAQLGDAAIVSVAQLPGMNLANERVRHIFEKVTGYAPPQEADWWRDYQAHAQRRHRIVHAGARVTRKDAESSIKAAEAMIAFLHSPSMSTGS
jgi:hypothetical protein